MDVFYPSLAPHKLWQDFDFFNFYQQSAQIGLLNINLGSTPAPKVEQRVLDEVGSYGRQLGRMGDALEVLMRHVPKSKLSPDEIRVLDILKGQLAEIRSIKAEEEKRR